MNNDYKYLENASFQDLQAEFKRNNLPEEHYHLFVKRRIELYLQALSQENKEVLGEVSKWTRVPGFPPKHLNVFQEKVFADFLFKKFLEPAAPVAALDTILNLNMFYGKEEKTRLFKEKVVKTLCAVSRNYNENWFKWYIRHYPEEKNELAQKIAQSRLDTGYFLTPDTSPLTLKIVSEIAPELLYRMFYKISSRQGLAEEKSLSEIWNISYYREALENSGEKEQIIKQCFSSTVQRSSKGAFFFWVELGMELPVDKPTLSTLVAKDKIKIMDYYFTHVSMDIHNHMFLRTALSHVREKHEQADSLVQRVIAAYPMEESILQGALAALRGKKEYDMLKDYEKILEDKIFYLQLTGALPDKAETGKKMKI